MTRTMSWPRIVLALAGLIALTAPASAAADDPCGRLFVPDGYRLTCTHPGGPAQADWQLTVQPAEGAFAPLSELSIHPVAEPVEDPAKWLRAQLTVDMSRFDAALDDLLHSADSPVADTPIVGQLESWRGLLHSVAGWPLTGCGAPESRAGGARWGMNCEWQLGPFRQYLDLRLINRDGARYAVQIRAMNEHRLHNLVAIANSF
jgi:hypothetical protein